MEIAIPLLVLGGMYVVSNNNNNNNNVNKEKKEDVVLKKQEIEEGFQSAAAATKTLDGKEFNPNTFQHNNMIPFNGGKVRGYRGVNDTILDNKVGQGTHYIAKREQAPLFGPSDFTTMTHGSQNQSDFIQSRVVLPLRQNNVKPMESEMVAPGLGKGYGTEGYGGFNSGLQTREQWMPKSVDELRAQTNPKIEYNLDGLQGPAMSSIKSINTPEVLGTIEKRRPDTYYGNDPSRWLTTTGVQKETMSRPVQEMRNVKRNDGNMNYTGAANATTNFASYTTPNFETSHRTSLPSAQVQCPAVSEHKMNSMAQQSYSNPQNNRSSNSQPVNTGVVGGIIKAMLAPVNHLFKPTLKEETIQNARVFGNAKSIVCSNTTMNSNNTMEPLKPTIKETTLHEPRSYVNNQREGFRVYNEQCPNQTQRETTSESKFVGGASSAYGCRVNDGAYNQTNNDIRALTIHNRPSNGGTQIFNPHMNATLPDKNVFNNQSPVPYVSGYQATTSVDTMGVYKLKNDSDDTMSRDRLDSNLLNSFRENPFTHSLSSVA